jgi:hypothetical protein
MTFLYADRTLLDRSKGINWRKINKFYKKIHIFTCFSPCIFVNQRHTPTKCTHVYVQLTHLLVSAQKGHLQGAESQNINTLVSDGPKYSHCI